MNEAITALRFSHVVQEVRVRTAEIKKDVPDHHGIAHDLSVVRFGTYIALVEGASVNDVQIASFIHDIRWWDSQERRIRRIPPQQGSENLPSASDILTLLRAEKRITRRSHDAILEAVLLHSDLPKNDEARPLLARCLADSDRLSRLEVGGLLSILDANKNYGEPFYTPGSEIVRAEDAPMIPFDQIHSCVDDINSCIDWEKIMETTSGRSLANHLVRVNRQFHRTFAEYSNLSYEVWIPWLSSIQDKQTTGYRRLERHLNQKRAADFRREIISLEDPQLVSQVAFAHFR